MQIFVGDIFKESSTPLHTVGDTFKPYGDKGPKFVYAKNGAVALAKGKFVQSAVPDSNLSKVDTTVASVVGATTVYMTAGGAVAANALAGGLLIVQAGASALGDQHIIKSNVAVASGAMRIELDPQTPVRTLFVVGTTKLTALANPYNGVVIVPTTATAEIVGLPLIAVTANYYFWLLVEGDTNALCQGTPAIGTQVTYSGSASGAFAAYSLVSGGVITQTIGRAIETGVNAEYTGIHVTCGRQ